MSRAELSTSGFPSPAPPPLTTTDGLIHRSRVNSRIEATIPGKSVLVMRQHALRAHGRGVAAGAINGVAGEGSDSEGGVQRIL
jgi:hypothetical protein